MAAAAAASANAAPPVVDPARFALAQRVHLWKLEVRLAVEKLLSLGSIYEVHYTFPRVRLAVATAGQGQGRKLSDFGLDVVTVASSHLFQVSEVRSSRFVQRFVDIGHDEKERPSTTPGIGLNDYLVGLGVDNLLLSPMNLTYFRKHLASVVQQCEQEQDAGRSSTVVLRFVRFNQLVEIEHHPHDLSHWEILQTLDDLEAQRVRLTKQYERFDRETAKRLQVEKKVLLFVRIRTNETRANVMKAHEFRLMERFQSWFKELSVQDYRIPTRDEFLPDVQDAEYDEPMDDTEDVNDVGGMDDVDDVVEEEAPQVVTIDSNDEDDVDDMTIDLTNPDFSDDEDSDDGVVEILDLAPDAPQRRAQASPRGQSAAPRPVHFVPSAPSEQGRRQGQAKSTRGQNLPKAPARQPMPSYNIDASWIDVFPSQDLRWLSNAKSTLKTFMNGVADSFQSEYEGNVSVLRLSRAIVESLFRLYLRKRGHTANATLQKEFTRHARMLRSNLKNASNHQLRSDLVNGRLAPQRLCEMTSDELAPEALRRERELRFEKHAQQNMLKEPTGKIMKKTKNGIVEIEREGRGGSQDTDSPPTLESINLGHPTVVLPTTDVHASSDAGGVQDSVMADHSYAPQAKSDAHTSDGAASASTTVAPSAHTVNGDVAERFEASAGIQETAPKLKKRVSFASEPIFAPEPASAKKPAATANNSNKSASTVVPSHRHVVTAAEGKAFLLALFGPTYDLPSQLQEWAAAVGRTPLSTMSREFDLAPGVKLYRELRSSVNHGTVASLQLGHIYQERGGRDDRQATLDAYNHLWRALAEFQRLFGDLLRTLSTKFRLVPSNDSRQVRDATFNYLVQSNIVKLSTPEVRRFVNGAETVEYDAVATIDELPLARRRDTSSRMASAAAIDDLMTFLMQLVAQFIENQAVSLQEERDIVDNAQESMPKSVPVATEHKVEPVRVESPEPMEIGDDSGEWQESQVSRKRRYEPLPNERESTRRRVDNDAAVTENAERTEFFVDAVGARPVEPTRPRDVVLKAQAEAYQELVIVLFEDHEMVINQLKSMDWRDQDEVVFAFTPKLTIRGTITRDQSNQYKCSLVGTENMLEVVASAGTADAARKKGLDSMIYKVHRVYKCWKQLLETFKERRKHTPTTLMAGNEAQQKHKTEGNAAAAWRFVSFEEGLLSNLPGYHIRIDGKLAMFAVANTGKDAKRSANEFFRDFMELLCRKESMTAKRTPSAAAARPAAQNGGSTTRPPPPASSQKPASSSKRSSNLVLCSEDEDDDDDDGYSSGGSSDWEPSGPKSGESVPSVSLAEEEMKRPYQRNSEQDPSDDAKYRAVIRSLFTPSDDLCAGISALRGSLKYRGSAENKIVPNVKASIRMNRMRENIFEVRVDVNDVVHYTATAPFKNEACRDAVDGIIERLNLIRSKWVQLLHFLHVKSLGQVNFLDSYNAMKLTGIVSINTTVETEPPSRSLDRRSSNMPSAVSGVRCVVRADNDAVFRVVGQSESDARIIADCRMARFFMDLIDSGLDPEPIDEVKDGVADNTPDAAGARSPDWKCLVRVQDTGNCDVYHEVGVDAWWHRPDRAPRDTAFSPSSDITMTQLEAVPILELESLLKDRHESVLMFFRIESVSDQWKLVRYISEYGNKNSSRARALKMQVTGGSRFDVYIIPPGSTINGEERKLYWPDKALPRDISTNWREIYGLMTPKHL